MGIEASSNSGYPDHNINVPKFGALEPTTDLNKTFTDREKKFLKFERELEASLKDMEMNHAAQIKEEKARKARARLLAAPFSQN